MKYALPSIAGVILAVLTLLVVASSGDPHGWSCFFGWPFALAMFVTALIYTSTGHNGWRIATSWLGLPASYVITSFMIVIGGSMLGV